MSGNNKRNDGVYWRADNGSVRCLFDDCPAICNMDCPIYLQTLGLESFERNDFKEAIDLLTQSVTKEPSFGDAWNNLAMCYGTIGDHQKAFECYQKAYDLRKKSNSLYGMAVASKHLKQYSAALNYAKMYMETYGTDQQILAVVAGILQNCGNNGPVQ